MEFLLLLAKYLLLTAAVEGALIALIFRRLREVRYSLLANVMTNPALNLLLALLAGNLSLPYWPVTAGLEVCAVAAEAWVYRSLCDGFGWGRAFGLSALLNAASFSVGVLVNAG